MNPPTLYRRSLLRVLPPAVNDDETGQDAGWFDDDAIEVDVLDGWADPPDGWGDAA